MAVEQPVAAVDGIPPWPGILTHPRRAFRGAADRKSWFGPLLLYLGVPIGTWALQSMTGAPPPQRTSWTGHALGDLLVGLCAFTLVAALVFFGLGRAIGGRATLAEVFIALLWSSVPIFLISLPVDVFGLLLYEQAWWATKASGNRLSTLSELPAPAIALCLFDRIVSIWSLGLSIVGLSEVHRLGAGRVLMLLVVPLFLIGVIAAIAAAVLVASLSVPGS